MYGQKQIMQCMAVVVVVSILNFYRNAIKRDREMQTYRQANVLKRKLEAELVPDPALLVVHQQFNDLWLEYDGQCNAVHIFVIRPEPISEFTKLSNVDTAIRADADNNSDISLNGGEGVDDEAGNGSGMRSRGASVSDRTSEAERGSGCETLFTVDGTCGHSSNKQISLRDGAGRQTVLKPQSVKVMDTAKESSGIIIYVFVIVLLASLVKAALDVSKHIREVSLCLIAIFNKLLFFL